MPYSFLCFIFVNRQEFEQGLIREEILYHEAVHVQQKHSIDILILELVQVLFWFNPFLIFYRKAMRLNHEYLADQGVIRHFPDMAAYQQLLISTSGQPTTKAAISSPFHFITIKKRLIMMKKSTSRAQVLCRQSLATLALFGSVLVWGNYVAAQKQAVSADSVIANKDKGISQKDFDEYQNALKMAEIPAPDANGVKVTGHAINKVDRQRMDFLYYSMSPEQKQKATNVGFIPTPLPPAKQSPSAAQLTEWANSSQFRIWKDGERLGRAALKGYKPGDFVYYKVVPVASNSIDFGKFSYYVDVMTEAYYNASYIAKTKWNLRISRAETQYLQ